MLRSLNKICKGYHFFKFDLLKQKVSGFVGLSILSFMFSATFQISYAQDLVINSEVIIAEGDTVETNSVTINPDGRLVVEGTLIVNGNFTMNFSGNNESEFVMGSNSLTIVKGNVHLTNKVSLNLSSYFIILGNLTKDGSASQSDIVINDASIYVFGYVDPSSGLDVCDQYDGLTENNNESCHVGSETAYDDNVTDGTIPPDITELVNDCDPPEIDNQLNVTTCESYVLPIITGSNLSGNEAYYTASGGTGIMYNTGDEITSTTTLFIYDANDECWDEVSFDITIENNPIAGSMTKTPDLTTVCEGTFVSSVLTGGSAGNGTDELEYSADGGNNWNIYLSGNNISTTGVSEVQIRTRRMADYCSPSAYVTVIWNVDPASVGGTATANDASVCENDNTIIELSGYTGTIQWQQSTDGFTGWNNVIGGSGETTATYTTPDLTTTTFYRAVVSNGGVCSSSNSTVVEVTVNPLPEIGSFN